MTFTSVMNDQKGFALVDVLVALTIAGLAGSVMIGLIAFVGHQTFNLDRKAQIRSGFLSVDLTLRSLAEHAYLLDGAGTGPHGSPDEFFVISEGPPILLLSRSTAFTLKREKQVDTEQLVLIWRDQKTKQERHEVVMQDLKSVSFSYFGKPIGSDSPAWHSSWSARAGHLEAVRLSLRTSSMQSEMEFMAPIRSQVSVSCLRDPAQRQCATELP